MLRCARPDDVSGICTLLSAQKLPTIGVFESLSTFIVFESSGSIVGVGGLELHGSFALLRSLAVVPDHQGEGIASAICERLEIEAVNRGVADIYLLTETAERFFSKRGYVPIDRADAPVEIASSEEFSVICPESAALMRRSAQQCAAADA